MRNRLKADSERRPPQGATHAHDGTRAGTQGAPDPRRRRRGFTTCSCSSGSSSARATHSVAATTDPTRASLTLFSELRPDLILLDLHMPVHGRLRAHGAAGALTGGGPGRADPRAHRRRHATTRSAAPSSRRARLPHQAARPDRAAAARAQPPPGPAPPGPARRAERQPRGRGGASGPTTWSTRGSRSSSASPLAAEYRDDATQEHAWRIGRTCALLAAKLGLPDARGRADPPRGAAPRHRQDRHLGPDPAQAGQAHRTRSSSSSRRTPRSAPRSSRAARARCCGSPGDRPDPPRALGRRAAIPHGLRRRGDPDRRPDRRGGRRVRRADPRAARTSTPGRSRTAVTEILSQAGRQFDPDRGRGLRASSTIPACWIA